MDPALIWLLIGLVLIGSEVVSGELFLVMLGGGALAAAAGAALGLTLLPAAGVGGAVAVLLLLAVRPVAKRRLAEHMGTFERH